MSWPRRALLFVGTLVLAGTAVALPAPKAEAAPTACVGPVIAFGRQQFCGYFKNRGNNFGNEVRIGGIPAYVNTAAELIQLVQWDLTSGNTQRVTAAQFIIQNMRGRGPGAPQSVSAAEFNDWAERVRSYANLGENGWQSFGENGRIDWSVWQHMPCGTINTFYQLPPLNDVAPYRQAPSNSQCNKAWTTDEFMLFRDTNGNIVYRIRRACMNPMGEIGPLQQPKDDYRVVPSITATESGNPINIGVEVGQTIRFTYTVTNTGTDPSPNPTNCTIYTNVRAGYFPTPPVPTGSGGPGPPPACAKSFSPGPPTTVVTENVPVLASNQTICRSLFVSPSSPILASLGFETCVPVVKKPYLKVYGGDISVGNGQTTAPGSCTANPDGAAISWNRGGGSGYAGAGAQYGVLALGAIYQVASASGSALAPSGLAFANTSPSGSVYGGSFGSLPCVPDYYGTRPASPMSFTTLPAANVSGAYTTSGPGPFAISGAVSAGRRITLFVQGDVLITGDITYPANWTSGDVPLFQLVVKGNIFVRSNVTRLDGVYIAQPNGAGSGVIHTCAVAAAALVPGPGLNAACSSKLTINGAFVANDVRFLRTQGTRQQALAGEASGSGNIAEVFNFSPVLWMAQPVGQSGTTHYDSITALPPVL